MTDLATRSRRILEDAATLDRALARSNVLIASVCGVFLGVLCAAFI